MYTGYACVGLIQEYMNGKFCGRRPVGRPRLRRKDNHKGLVAFTKCGILQEVRRGLEHLEGKLPNSAKEEDDEEDREEEKEKGRGGGGECG